MEDLRWMILGNEIGDDGGQALHDRACDARSLYVDPLRPPRGLNLGDKGQRASAVAVCVMTRMFRCFLARGSLMMGMMGRVGIVVRVTSIVGMMMPIMFGRGRVVVAQLTGDPDRSDETHREGERRQLWKPTASAIQRLHRPRRY